MSAQDRNRDKTRPAPRARLIASLAALLMVAVTATGTAPGIVRAETPDGAGPTVLGDLVMFHGRGYGHGLGMSQYGARGRALAGEDATTILAHYYQGATLGVLDPTIRIRVLVLSRWAPTDASPLVIHGRVTPWTVDGIAAVFPPDARLRLTPAPTGWRLVVETGDGTVLFEGASAADIVIRAASEESRLQLSSKPTRYDRYRGSLRVILDSTTRVSVVNDLTLEQYLPGVVPVEMPPTWPAAALQAQAIAARSYAARRLRPAASYFDVTDGSSSQIYRGVLAEKPSPSAAIAATAGMVLMGGTTIANALFHSTGGGATEANENVYTSATGRRIARPVGYLRGAIDRAPDGTPYDAGAPYATWTTRTYSRAQLSAWFAADPRTNVGDLVAIDLRDRGVSGRLVSVTLIGSTGSRTVSGEIFRAVFNAGRPRTDPSLKSTLLNTAPIP